MQVQTGQHYTFSFTPGGIDLSGPFSSLGNSVVQSLIDAGFPLQGATASQAGDLLGYATVKDINISFTYTGAVTESDTLGQAMADHLNADFFSTSFTFSGAQGGEVAAPGSLTDLTKNLPSATSIGIGVVAIGLIALLVFGFSEGLGKGVA
jgi:hypothetical protein